MMKKKPIDQYLAGEISEAEFKLTLPFDTTYRKKQRMPLGEYWHTTYLITNDCGLFYIGLHSFKKSLHPDPWKYNGKYYGSGAHLKEALKYISHGWNPILITSVHPSRREACWQETSDIHSVPSAEFKMCLNHWFKRDEWTDMVQKHLEDTYGRYVSKSYPRAGRLECMRWLESHHFGLSEEELIATADGLYQYGRDTGKSWAYHSNELIPAKTKVKRKDTK